MKRGPAYSLLNTDDSRFDGWEAEIRALEAANAELLAKTPDAPGPIVFTGSSTIRLWFSLARDFAGYAVVNRGFGGSQIDEATHFAPRIVVPLRPRQVVFYSGENDLALGKSSRRVVADARRFTDAVLAACPEAILSFISVKPSPGRAELLASIRSVNASLEELCAGRAGLDFIDVSEAMLDEQGSPRRELWTSDGVHLSRAGYKLWAEIVRPHLTVNGAES